MQLPRGHLVRMDSCSSRGGVRKGSAVFFERCPDVRDRIAAGPGPDAAEGRSVSAAVSDTHELERLLKSVCNR